MRRSGVSAAHEFEFERLIFGRRFDHEFGIGERRGELLGA